MSMWVMVKIGFSFVVAMLLWSPVAAEPVTRLSGAQEGKIEFRTFARDRQVIWGTLSIPKGAGPHPVMIVMHGSAGPRPAREGRYASQILDMGIATFLLDSFGPRGVETTGRDQARVSGRTLVGDAFAALRLLVSHPRIDRRRIGIIGFSKGATVALNVAASQFNDRYMRRGSPRFAVHVALYPWCGLQFRRIRTTGAPILMLIGDADDYTGAKPCVRYVERMKKAGADARLILYPGAHHAFDHDPRLRNRHLPRAQNFSRCSALRDDDLRVIDPATDRRFSSRDAASAFFRRCMTQGATIGANPAARRRAMVDLKAFLRARLLPAGAPAK